MDKIWLKSYPAGVPAEINPDQYNSIVEMFLESCELYPAQPAFYGLGTTITYQELKDLSHAFAAYLQNKLQIKKGDRLAIMLPNILQYPVALFGAMLAGAIVVNVNPLYTKEELTHQLNDAGAETLVVVENFAATVTQSLPQLKTLKHIIITKVGDMLPFVKGCLINFALKYVARKIPAYNLPNHLNYKSVLTEGKNLNFSKVALTNQDIAFLQYTGGTTGVSKGAVLTHRNIVANVLQSEAWFKILLASKTEIIITALPLYHVFSLMANCLFFVKIGGFSILIPNPRNLPSVFKDMRKFKFTALTGVNTLFAAMLKSPLLKDTDFSHLRLSLGAGMAVQKVVAEKWQAATNAPLLEGYGLTETSPVVTVNPANLKKYNGSIGLPVPSTDVAILDDNGDPVAIGETGEISVKGPQVMQGYWQNKAETDKVFSKDGWLLTGDLGTMDENGFIRLLERKKDMIIVSGFNVYPNEIEDVLVRNPKVREAAVIAVPDDNSGEVPKAFIVPETDDVTPQELMQFCRQYLTGYKIPKQFEFVDELPKSNVGKILRRALRK